MTCKIGFVFQMIGMSRLATGLTVPYCALESSPRRQRLIPVAKAIVSDLVLGSMVFMGLFPSTQRFTFLICQSQSSDPRGSMIRA